MARRRVWEDYDVVLDNNFGLPLAPWSMSVDFRRFVFELELPRTGSTIYGMPTRRSCSAPAFTRRP
jgi:hypothetical protein